MSGCAYCKLDPAVFMVKSAEDLLSEVGEIIESEVGEIIEAAEGSVTLIDPVGA
jgi:hypothetical protein